VITVERLEDRLCPAVPKPTLPIPPVGVYPAIDALVGAGNGAAEMKIYQDKYAADVAARAKLTSPWHTTGVIFVTVMVVPLGLYVADKTIDKVAQLDAVIQKDEMFAWYIGQQIGVDP
jgi:hypothetical protein